jgi:sigma-B regulation protein RsbU (phosphoserine phosphatase)
MALTLSLVRSTVRAAQHGPVSAARVLEAVNEGLCTSNPSAMFVTMLALVLDSRTGALEIANAGHLPAWRLTPGGEVDRVGLPGALPLGVDPGVRYEAACASLGPGDAVLVCSDGVTEARDETGRMLGPEGVAETLARFAGRSPREIVDALLAATRSFARDATEPDDDLTALTLRRIGEL